MELYGIAEAPGLLFDGHFEGTRASFPVLRPDEDIVEHILCRHRDLGVCNVIWQLGRSFLTYHTDDPRLTVQGSITREEGLENELLPHSRVWHEYMARTCPLRRALDVGADLGLTLWGWLCMNRNYSESNGKVHCSRFWLRHREEMGEYTKAGERDYSRLCYAYGEYQEERLAAVLEAVRAVGPGSGRHLEAVVLDFVRQPPMLLYHPRLCAGYQETRDRDPRAIPAQDVDAFLAWCRYRADILTGFMRMVRREVHALGQSVRLLARITDLGININLIEGIDLPAWCDEGLIDGIVTSPLNWARTIWEHDLRPYVSLAQRHDIPVIAGVCLNQQTRFHRNGASVNYAVLARRVADYQQQGADAIALYQSECGLEFDGIDQVIPSFAEPAATAALLSDPAFLERWPVTHLNCAYGLDCHSHFNNFTIDTDVSPL